MYDDLRISLVFPAYNEEKNITQAITSFRNLKIVDEIVVVDNNSTDKTALLAKKKHAKVVTEKKQGYGFALRKGLGVAKGDVIVLCEPDGTFEAKDLLRMLKVLKIKKVDAVLGSRTNLKYIRRGANMKFALRTGNIALAKCMQVLFGMPPLSDCGCTFRILKKSVVKKILPNLKVGSSHFLPEVVIAMYTKGFSFVEVPVHYGKRIGVSKITGSLTKSIEVGWNMFSLIISSRISR